MNLTGGRTTLILNICALILALIINTEITYITYSVDSRLPHWADLILGFIPVLVMFIIRSWGFSYIFLFFHFVIAVGYFLMSRSVYLGDHSVVGHKLPFFHFILLIFLSLFSLAAYAIIVLVRAALALLNKPKQSVADNRD